MTSGEPLYVVGDVHGYYDKLVAVLRGAGFLNTANDWAGGMRRLLFMGDFVDRGPNGIAVIDLVMRLQREAKQAGGQVLALMGNHEIMFLAAKRFGNRPGVGDKTFYDFWNRIAGGKPADLAALRLEHINWIKALPAMALIDNRLVMHADAMFYLDYGVSIEEVNESFAKLLESDDTQAWSRNFAQFSERKTFTDQEPGGTVRAATVLGIYGGRQLIHGHTPISIMRGGQPEEVTAPYSYAGSLCVNVDPGLYLGGPGFVAEFRRLG